MGPSPEQVQATPRRARPCGAQAYPVAPLIRFTLLTLYLALVLPLPLLAPRGLGPWLWGPLPLGLVLVSALLSEQVILDPAGIEVGHPDWCAWLLRRGWRLGWDEVGGLVRVATSQGGTVHYIRGPRQQRYLLPQRVARFPTFLLEMQRATGLDLSGIGRLTPPWTYWTLAALSTLLLVGELVAGLSFPWAAGLSAQLALAG